MRLSGHLVARSGGGPIRLGACKSAAGQEAIRCVERRRSGRLGGGGSTPL